MERLRDYVRLVTKYELQVAVELGGCLDFSPLDDTAGEWSDRRELSAIERFYAAGGKVDSLDLNGPIRRRQRTAIAPREKHRFEMTERDIWIFTSHQGG